MQTGSPYSPLKIIHHPDRLARLRNGWTLIPAQVQLIISDLCNQDCSFCAYRMSGYSSNQLFAQGSELAAFGHDNPKRTIPLEKVLEILDDCQKAGVGAIQITGGGEPTVHPDHPEIFRAVLERGMDLGLVSNGAIFREGVRDLLLHAKWCRFSVDAGCRETYARIRRVSPVMWDKVWENVGSLVATKRAALAAPATSPEAISRKMAAADLVIGIGFVVTRDNWTEVVDCTARARAVGVDNIRLSALFSNDDERHYDGIFETVSEMCRQAETLATPEFEVFNNFGARVSDLRQHAPDYEFCGYQQFNTYIGGDLNVYRCCVTAYNRLGLIGSLKDQRLRDFWSSQEYETAMQKFNAKACPRCMFHSKNKTILYALEPAPRHVNFV